MQDKSLSNGVYWVKDLSDYSWFDNKKRHDLSPEGIVVVRPVADPDGNPWYKENIISWFDFPEHEMLLNVPPEQLAANNPDLEYPPAAFLTHLKFLNLETETPIAFYHCLTFGGEIEAEYSWIFDREETAYLRITDGPNRASVLEHRPGRAPALLKIDLLAETLRHFTINLPTTYFALHTRGVPWPRYKIQ